MSKLEKQYKEWRKKNVSPDCISPVCDRPDRGGACGQCANWIQDHKS